jgi:hypothetical protein
MVVGHARHFERLWFVGMHVDLVTPVRHIDEHMVQLGLEYVLVHDPYCHPCWDVRWNGARFEAFFKLICTRNIPDLCSKCNKLLPESAINENGELS